MKSRYRRSSHAWSVVTHDLVYKADEIDWRRARLAAHLKASVEQIELVIAGFEQTIEFVPKSSFPAVEGKSQIVEVFRQLYHEGFVTEELRPTSWSRFAENVYSLVSSYSNRYQTPHRVAELCSAVEHHVRTDDPWRDLHSGSLFQALLGLIYRGVIPNGRLDSYVIVDSSELRDVHGVRSLSRPFRFD